MSTGDDRKNDRLLQDGSLAFFGAITASVSHELNNVVSIVDQTAGLMADLLVGAEQGRPITNERIARIAERLTAQSERGVGIIKRLNKFAHSVDEPIIEYELDVVLDNLVALMNRFADLKRVTLVWNGSGTQVKVTGNPFEMQQAVYHAYRWVLANTPAGETVELSASQDADGVRLLALGPDAAEEVTLNLAYMQLLMARLGGSITAGSSDGRRSVELIIPLSVTGQGDRLEEK